MTTIESLRAIRENLDLSKELLNIIERKIADGSVTTPISATVLVMVQIETKNATDHLVGIHANLT